MPPHEDESQFSQMTAQAAATLVASSQLCATVFVGERSFTLTLPADGIVVVGRANDAQLHLPSASVSRAHARLEMTDGGERAVLTDLGSRNGSLVNGIKIEAPRAVSHGDELTAGDVRVLFLRRSAVPLETIAFMARSVFTEQLDTDVAHATAMGSPLWLFALELPQRWYEAVTARRELEALPRMGYYGVLADNVIGIATPQTREDEALAIEEMIVTAMKRARITAACAMAPLRRGASASDLVEEALEALSRAGTEGGEEVNPEAPIAHAPAMVALLDQARQIALSPLHVLLVGETGAGKEVLARFLHKESGRTGPLVSVNAAALPDALLESELFGHERGAFSGATQAKVGLIEAAHKGTLFLDEIGELPLTMQAKLLRVLEDLTVRRVGATTERKVDVRFVSATNRNLEDAVRTREFRQDLLFRLNAGILKIPPLRERRSEIGPLAHLFLARGAAARSVPAPKISAAALAVLEEYDWPGNIRELRNVMDRALALSNGASIAPKHLPEALDRGIASLPGASMPPPAISAPNQALPEGPGPIRDSVASYERERIEQALAQSEGNQTRAAALLGIPRRTLAYRMNRLGIRSRA